MKSGTDEKRKNKRKIYLDTNLQIIFGITLTYIIGVASITPAFPKIVKDLNISAKDVGLLIAVFSFPGILLTPFLGVIADRWGGFFGPLRNLVGVEKLCMLFYDDPSFVEEMMDADADLMEQKRDDMVRMIGPELRT